MAAVAGRQHAVEHVDAARGALDEIRGRAGAHEDVRTPAEARKGLPADRRTEAIPVLILRERRVPHVAAHHRAAANAERIEHRVRRSGEQRSVEAVGEVPVVVGPFRRNRHLV